MKLFGAILILVTSLTSSAQTNSSLNSFSEFTLTGNLNALKGSVELIPFSGACNPKHILTGGNYTASIIKGRFSIEGVIPFPSYFRLRYVEHNKVRYVSDFFVIEPGHQQGQFTLNSSSVSVHNKTMDEYGRSQACRGYKRLKKDYHWLASYADSLHQVYGNALPRQLQEELEAIKANYQQRYDRLLISLCLELPTSDLSLWQLLADFTKNGFRDDYDALFSELSPGLKQSQLGILVKQGIDASNVIGQGKKLPLYVYTNPKQNSLDSMVVKAKYTLVQFWNTSCGSCIASIPQMQALYTAYATKGFDIISICYDKKERLASLQRILTKYQPSWREYFDEEMINSRRLMITYPRYILLDASGLIIDNRSEIETVKTLLAAKLN